MDTLCSFLFLKFTTGDQETLQLMAQELNCVKSNPQRKKKKQLIFVFFISVRCLYSVTLTNQNWGWHKEGGREDHTLICGGQDYPSGCQPDLDLIKAIVKLPSETLEEGQAKKPSF